MLLFSAQFFCTLWLNLFLIVSSHEFETARISQTDTKAAMAASQADRTIATAMASRDWGVHQVRRAYRLV